MSQIDYVFMSLDQVKRYFLQHRDDTEAFYAYMDKLNASGRAIVIDPPIQNQKNKRSLKFRSAYKINSFKQRSLAWLKFPLLLLALLGR